MEGRKEEEDGCFGHFTMGEIGKKDNGTLVNILWGPFSFLKMAIYVNDIVVTDNQLYN